MGSEDRAFSALLPLIFVYLFIISGLSTTDCTIIKTVVGDIMNNIKIDAMNAMKHTVNNIGATQERNITTDCLGVSDVLAKGLEALFKSDENGSYALDTHFLVLSRRKPQKVKVAIGKEFRLDGTDFDVNRNTALIVHGFWSSGTVSWVSEMASALLAYADMNVIIVDWSAGSQTINYVKAAMNTQTTGDQIATLLGQITKHALHQRGPNMQNWGNIHCIGHSLGSHVCGFAAHEIKMRGGKWRIGRITGMDPAQPCFQSADLAARLDKSDAPYVDIIHTNGRYMLDLGLGFPEPIGHADFYPNGGKVQPGCDEIKKHTFPLISIPKEEISRTVCSHGRSYVYFTESIIDSVYKNCSFWSHPWDRTYKDIGQIMRMDCDKTTCIEMGIKSESYHPKGSFFTMTSATPPYCHPKSWDKKKVENILKQDRAEVHGK